MQPLAAKASASAASFNRRREVTAAFVEVPVLNGMLDSS
jgi:hypothetical protein